MDGLTLCSVADFRAERRVPFKWQNGNVLLIDTTLVKHCRDTFVFTAVCIHLCVDSQFASQWDATRELHLRQSVLTPSCETPTYGFKSGTVVLSAYQLLNLDYMGSAS